MAMGLFFPIHCGERLFTICSFSSLKDRSPSPLDSLFRLSLRITPQGGSLVHSTLSGRSNLAPV